MLEWLNVCSNVTMWTLTHYIYLYLLDRRYLTGYSTQFGASPGRVRVVCHGGPKS